MAWFSGCHKAHLSCLISLEAGGFAAAQAGAEGGHGLLSSPAPARTMDVLDLGQLCASGWGITQNRTAFHSKLLQFLWLCVLFPDKVTLFSLQVEFFSLGVSVLQPPLPPHPCLIASCSHLVLPPLSQKRWKPLNVPHIPL